MANPFNPMDWVQSAQDWFKKTERSSGYRPFLIYLIILVGLDVTILTFFRNTPQAIDFVMFSLYASFGTFVVHFSIMSFHDPNFCRSEKHIENIRRIEVMEEKDSGGPIPIDADVVRAVSADDKNIPHKIEKKS